MIVLGIESTCDETACAIVKDGKEILSNVVSSQIDLQREFGGVVPELACRRHTDVIIPVVDQALNEAKITLDRIDLIAVSYGPGLIGALLIGINVAKALSLALDKPLIGVNHVEAHLFGAIMSSDKEPLFPSLGVVLSGGHTTLVKVHSIGKYEMISETVDDAIGEAFDKVAKMLNLPYPGGPEIERLALNGDSTRYPLTPGYVKNQPLHFSFSGIKTGVLYTIKREAEKLVAKDLAASFQSVAFKDVVKKTLLAADKYQLNTLIFGGGVTSNSYLREIFKESAPSKNLIFPKPDLSLDNAAMIAGLGYHRFHLENDPFCMGLSIEAKTRISAM